MCHKHVETSMYGGLNRNFGIGLDDLVSQDLPSMLRFVHAQTNQLIDFVGYSQARMMLKLLCV